MKSHSRMSRTLPPKTFHGKSLQEEKHEHIRWETAMGNSAMILLLSRTRMVYQLLQPETWLPHVLKSNQLARFHAESLHTQWLIVDARWLIDGSAGGTADEDVVSHRFQPTETLLSVRRTKPLGAKAPPGPCRYLRSTPRETASGIHMVAPFQSMN